MGSMMGDEEVEGVISQGRSRRGRRKGRSVGNEVGGRRLFVPSPTLPAAVTDRVTLAFKFCFYLNAHFSAVRCSLQPDNNTTTQHGRPAGRRRRQGCRQQRRRQGGGAHHGGGQQPAHAIQGRGDGRDGVQDGAEEAPEGPREGGQEGRSRRLQAASAGRQAQGGQRRGGRGQAQSKRRRTASTTLETDRPC